MAAGTAPGRSSHPAPADTAAYSGREGDGAGRDSMSENTAPGVLVKLKGGGGIIIELYPDEAPLTVERFLELAAEGFYDRSTFHRVESYLVQAGRKGGDMPPIEGEMFGQSLKHVEGMVGMARLPSDYDSATNQFYICKKELPRLNGEYTLFGRVTEGMDLVHAIKKGAEIESITPRQ
jgi:peptidyl-prolyl cis-trans isomerase B (cyclophilin B)